MNPQIIIHITQWPGMGPEKYDKKLRGAQLDTPARVRTWTDGRNLDTHFKLITTLNFDWVKYWNQEIFIRMEVVKKLIKNCNKSYKWL